MSVIFLCVCNVLNSLNFLFFCILVTINITHLHWYSGMIKHPPLRSNHPFTQQNYPCGHFTKPLWHTKMFHNEHNFVVKKCSISHPQRPNTHPHGHIGAQKDALALQYSNVLRVCRILGHIFILFYTAMRPFSFFLTTPRTQRELLQLQAQFQCNVD